MPGISTGLFSPLSPTSDKATSPTLSLSRMFSICTFPSSLTVPILVQDIINSSLDYYKCHFTDLPPCSFAFLVALTFTNSNLSRMKIWSYICFKSLDSSLSLNKVYKTLKKPGLIWLFLLTFRASPSILHSPSILDYFLFTEWALLSYTFRFSKLVNYYCIMNHSKT